MGKSTITKGQSAYKKLLALKSKGLFKPIKVLPSAIRFDGQEEDENIVLFLRQHIVILIMYILESAFYIFLAILGAFALKSLGVKASIIMAVLLLGFLYFITALIYSVAKWYFNVFIVTNMRLIDLDFTNLFSSRWSGTPLDRVEDISVATPGIYSTFFNMGNLYIQTAAEKPEFEIKNVPDPHTMQDIVNDLVENAKNND